MIACRDNLLSLLSPEVIWSIVHDGVIIIIVVSGGIVVILIVEISVFSLPDILLDDLDVLVPVGPGVLVVEAQRVHDLVHGSARATEAVTILVR